MIHVLSGVEYRVIHVLSDAECRVIHVLSGVEYRVIHGRRYLCLLFVDTEDSTRQPMHLIFKIFRPRPYGIL